MPLLNSYSDLSSLASALGGQSTIVDTTNDANTFVTSGHYRWDSSLYLPANCPDVNAAGEIEVIAFGYLVFQILRTNRGEMWQRAKWSTQAWTSWKAVSTDIPSFYKNYNSLAELKDALTGIFSAIPDGGLDVIDVQGLHIYSPISATAGGKGLGAVIHLQRSARNNSNCVALQIGVWRNYNGVWFREAIGANASFAAWHKLAEEN